MFIHILSVVTADFATLPDCISFEGRERKINIPQEIGTKYNNFGILLLEDTTGDKVRNIEHKYSKDAERINTEILRDWIAGKGKQPVSWETLTEVLCAIDLSILAGDIKAVKLQSP